jgi:hypothetical protein
LLIFRSLSLNYDLKALLHLVMSDIYDSFLILLWEHEIVELLDFYETFDKHKFDILEGEKI